MYREGKENGRGKMEEEEGFRVRKKLKQDLRKLTFKAPSVGANGIC
ncbi:MAG: hypothetical protein F6K07_16870 [Okeania sp. SIO1H5]|nr:hypothetical protein [Okeania sp. SIO1F9]NET20900.1 hypothetical protein [Okeania sp. SIO1H5]NET75795.1 hypothetical protein [Okeania sp. SIO1F9]NET94031.1 hypothetical protein [Okeania sp. SIO1H2]